jgi:hypothetical protein
MRSCGLCEQEPRLLVLARVIERDTHGDHWFGVYRIHALRLSAPLNAKLPAFCKGHACDIAEDFLHRLPIERPSKVGSPVPTHCCHSTRQKAVPQQLLESGSPTACH